MVPGCQRPPRCCVVRSQMAHPFLAVAPRPGSDLNAILDASVTNGTCSSGVRLTGLRSAAHLNGGAVQDDSIKTRVECVPGFSA